MLGFRPISEPAAPGCWNSTPAIVLTAAHCLYNPRTRALLQPVSLHVLFGFERDSYRRHLLIVRHRLGPGFTPELRQPQPGDWALLTLAESVPTRPLPLYNGPLAAGMTVTLAGYNQDRSQLLLADPDCHVRGIEALADGTKYLEHDCPATFGTSGGPLLAKARRKIGRSSASISPPVLR